MSNRTKSIVIFALRCAWVVFALIIWLAALNMTIHATSEGDATQAGLLCILPMAVPVIKFIIGVVRGTSNAGANVWDIEISMSGYIHASNRRFLYGIISLILIILVVIYLGLFILPLYWLYYVVVTVIMGFNIFRP